MQPSCVSGHSEVRRRRTEDRKKGGESSDKTLCISCTRDEGRPFGVGFQERASNHSKLLRSIQERASNHSKLLRSRAVVASVGVKALGRYPKQGGKFRVFDRDSLGSRDHLDNSKARSTFS
jgi:hypothetical protein